MDSRQESLWEPRISLSVSLHFTAFAADSQSCLIGTPTGSVHYHYQGSGLRLTPMFDSKVTAVGNLDTATYLVATQNRGLSRVTVSETGLVSTLLDIALPSPVTCLLCSRAGWVYLACESGVLLVLSETLRVLKKWDIDANCIEMQEGEGQRIVVSSGVRSCIVEAETGNTVQVGSKERKGWLGACHYKDIIIAARPNGFLWKANATDGKVLSTVKLSADDGSKLTYGLLFPWRNLLISYQREQKEMLLLDLEAGKLLQSTVFPHKTELYCSGNGSDVYRLTSKEGLFLLRQLSVLEAFHLYVQKRSLLPAIELVTLNSSLWNLHILQGICTLVFAETNCIQSQLMNNFKQIVEKLEQNSQIQITEKEEKISENREFGNRLESYVNLKKWEKARKIEILALKKTRKMKFLEAASFFGLKNWSEVKFYWKKLHQTRISLSKLHFSRNFLQNNDKIHYFIQVHLHIHSKYEILILKNRGVERVNAVFREIEVYRGYLWVAKRTFDREMYVKVREILGQLVELQREIM